MAISFMRFTAAASPSTESHHTASLSGKRPLKMSKVGTGLCIRVLRKMVPRDGTSGCLVGVPGPEHKAGRLARSRILCSARIFDNSVSRNSRREFSEQDRRRLQRAPCVVVHGTLGLKSASGWGLSRTRFHDGPVSGGTSLSVVTDEKVLNQGIYRLFGFPLALSGSELSKPASSARSQTRESGVASQSVEFLALAFGFRRHLETPCAEPLGWLCCA